MKVFIVWEHFCECFDIISNEYTTLVRVYESEESAYCAVEVLSEGIIDNNISYYYTENEVLP